MATEQGEQLLLSRDFPLPVCTTCQGTIDACTCLICEDCREVRLLSDVCERCGDVCVDCCNGHETCNFCDERVDGVCSNCDRCDECCECFFCGGCNESRNSDTQCSTCEQCENCCDCMYCSQCRARHDSDTAWCSDCDSCEDACRCSSDSIMDCSTNPLDHLRFHGEPDSGIYLGVELEVECSANPGDTAQRWLDAAPDWLICKSDGSLDHGFEIVTAPSDLPTHKEEWTQLLGNKRLVRDLKSWDTSTCGLHVHVSRKPLSQLTIGKVLVFMNSEKTRKDIVRLAGRDSNHYSEYGEKRVTAGAEVCCLSNGKKYLRALYGCSRYEAVNLRNDDTLEFRIFKGTLDLQHVLANIEFVDAVVRYCMQCSIRDCENWAAFWVFVELHKKTYANLVAYMTKEGA